MISDLAIVRTYPNAEQRVSMAVDEKEEIG
jgi:hypothetical protein